jgi:hypothetical protein
MTSSSISLLLAKNGIKCFTMEGEEVLVVEKFHMNPKASHLELENFILSEVSLAQKTKNRMFSLICGH